MAALSSSPSMPAVSDRQTFEERVLPHLDAAYNLARWLLRNEQAAEDAVQEASMRALRYLDSLRGDDARPWLLQIVRNTCFTWLQQNRPAEPLRQARHRIEGALDRHVVDAGGEDLADVVRHGVESRRMCRAMPAR